MYRCAWHSSVGFISHTFEKRPSAEKENRARIELFAPICARNEPCLSSSALLFFSNALLFFRRAFPFFSRALCFFSRALFAHTRKEPYRRERGVCANEALIKRITCVNKTLTTRPVSAILYSAVGLVSNTCQKSPAFSSVGLFSYTYKKTPAES